MGTEQRQNFDQVRAAELEVIAQLRSKNQRPPLDKNNPDDLIGLAISGGGIRSATFGLGVLETLKEKGWLKKLDYLSTVSGGGYIGAWLSGNCQRHGIGWLDQQLKPIAEQNNDEFTWEESIKFLRRYANYLSPNLSLFSADTWSMVTIWLRNTILIQLQIILLIAFFLLIPRVLWPMIGMESKSHQLINIATIVLFGVLIVWIADNLLRIKHDKNQHDTKTTATTYKPHTFLGNSINQFSVQCFVIVTMLICLGASAVLWSLAGYEQSFAGSLDKLLRQDVLVFFGFCYIGFGLFSYCSLEKMTTKHFGLAVVPILAFFFMFAAIVYVAGSWKGGGFIENSGSILAFAWIPPMVAAALSVTINLLIGMQGIDTFEAIREWWSRFGAWLAIYGFAWMAVVTISFYGPLWVEMLYYEGSWKTLGSGWLGTTLAGLLAGKSANTNGTGSDSLTSKIKELLAKATPVIFIVGLIILVSLVLHLVVVANTSQDKFSKEVLLGNTVFNAKQIAVQLDKTGENKPSTLPECIPGAQATAETATLCQNYAELKGKTNYLITDIQFDKEKLEELRKPPVPEYPKHWLLLAKADFRTVGYLVVLGLWIGGLACLLLLSWRIDINEFSLNAFYRNRLARCYLGATRKPGARTPHEFTGFDNNDDIPLQDLLELEPTKMNPSNKSSFGPFHIINCTLNLGGSKDLSMHTRHSAVFTLSPLYCGSDYVKRKTSGEPEEFRKDDKGREIPKEMGYHETAHFGGDFYPLTLGKAIAVSGAAASPNMGYHTSAPVSFLMTLFNARLGWWFPNPSQAECTSASPLLSSRYLLRELFGSANEDANFCAVSDGGHFENLAAYELIKRRCRVVIISDAECDPKLQFEGLANLIRLCQVDLRVKIDIDVKLLHPLKTEKNELVTDGSKRIESDTDWSERPYAIGRIIYGTDKDGKEIKEGVLLYIKASMTGDEETAVLQYKATHPDFPHETTGDQFYAEDQFESYRSLGKANARQALAGEKITTENEQEQELVKLLENILTASYFADVR